MLQSPLVPAKSGDPERSARSKRSWIPACAGMNGVESDAKRRRETAARKAAKAQREATADPEPAARPPNAKDSWQALREQISRAMTTIDAPCQAPITFRYAT